MRNSLLVLLLLGISVAHAAEIRGKVVNQTTGEALGHVAITVIESGQRTETAADGSFLMKDIPAGKYTLRIDAVGFWFHRMTIEISQTEAKEFSIGLTPQGARRRETVEVTADVFGGGEPAEVSRMTLTPAELRQTDTVLGADLFRSLQTLPGVTANGNNDLFAQPRVLGAPFSNVAVYIDDILVQQPFQGIGVHSSVIPNELEGGSLGILNDETVESVSLAPVAYSQRYSEGIGGALDIRTREGSRTPRPLFSVGVGMAESHLSAEGGVGQNRGSWLISARKSYLGYLARQTGASSALEPSFSDLDFRVTYDLTKHQALDISGIVGGAKLDNSYEDGFAEDKIFKGESSFSLARLAWRVEATPNLLFSIRGARTSSGDSTKNQMGNPLRRVNSAEWVAGSSVTWNWKPKQALEAGWNFRRITGSYRGYQYDPEYGWFYYAYGRSGMGERQGGYAQQSVTFWNDRLVLLGGLRFDQYSESDVHPLSPQVSGSLRVLPSTHLVFGTGRYVQFDAPSVESVPCGSPAPLVNTSDHYLAGIEQRIGNNLRIRIDGFERIDRSRSGIRGGDSMIGSLPGTSCGPVMESRTLQMDAGTRTQGVEFLVQKRSSNRLSGWISYTYLRQADELWYGTVQNGLETWFKSRTIPGYGDQKHTASAFGMYRLTPTLTLSGKVLYGSGYPLTWQNELLVYVDGQYWTKRRLDPFFRIDIRGDKSLNIRGERFTLHGEILNVTDHRNLRYIGMQYIGYAPGQPEQLPTLVRSLGITPAVGVDFQF